MQTKGSEIYTFSELTDRDKGIVIDYVTSAFIDRQSYVLYGKLTMPFPCVHKPKVGLDVAFIYDDSIHIARVIGSNGDNALIAAIDENCDIDDSEDSYEAEVDSPYFTYVH